MRADDQTSRREFVRTTGLAAAALGVAPLAAGAAQQPARPKPDDVLAYLLEGNKRFVDGKLKHPGRSPKDFQALAAGQAPPAVIVGCADSRVAPEVIFDQGVGELFVVRVAGNIVSGGGPLIKGSIEFAVGELGARLIVVLGHTECGACKAAITHIEGNDKLPGSIGPLIEPIRPIVRMVAGKPGDKLANVTRANVLAGVKTLEGLDPILSAKFKAGDLKVVGGVYDLATGKVELVG